MIHNPMSRTASLSLLLALFALLPGCKKAGAVEDKALVLADRAAAGPI